MRILITGITGFVGGHLTEALRAEGGHSLIGVARHATWGSGLTHLTGAADLHKVELLDHAALEQVIRVANPEWVFHLAGYASPRKSVDEREQCWSDNVEGTRALYESIARCGLRPRILFVSTGLVYGDSGHTQPITEAAALNPATPYAESKIAAEELASQYARKFGLPIVRVRLFNQIGPRQSTDYFSARFAQQIAAAEAGKQLPVIQTGDLSAHRDLTDIRDMVRAFRLLIEKGTPGEVYNAGRGQTWRISEVLDRLVKLSRVPLEVKQSIPPNHKPETAITRADTTKLRTATGWQPKYELEETLLDVLNYWREVVGRG